MTDVCGCPNIIVMEWMLVEYFISKPVACYYRFHYSKKAIHKLEHGSGHVLLCRHTSIGEVRDWCGAMGSAHSLHFNSSQRCSGLGFVRSASNSVTLFFEDLALWTGAFSSGNRQGAMKLKAHTSLEFHSMVFSCCLYLYIRGCPPALVMCNT